MEDGPATPMTDALFSFCIVLCDNQDIPVPPYLFSFLSCGRFLKELEILKSSKDGKNEISNLTGAENLKKM